jgi:hypothetical protein
MARLVFSHTGYVVHHPASSLSKEGSAHVYRGRIPVVVRHRDVYVGAPNWTHNDIANHFHISSDPHSDDYGYFAGDSEWGGGELTWFDNATPDHEEVAKALVEAGYHLPGLTHWH